MAYEVTVTEQPRPKVGETAKIEEPTGSGWELISTSILPKAMAFAWKRKVAEPRRPNKMVTALQRHSEQTRHGAEHRKPR